MQYAENGNRFSYSVALEQIWTFGFAVALLLGAYLRLRGLTFQSYWDDELFSVAVSDPANSLADVIRLTLSDVHPPLFQVLLWFWFKVFGFSEITGRIFPAMFGILSIFLLFRLGCEIANRKIGFFCALICAINIFHLRYSQEVRSYSLLFLLVTLSMLFLVRSLDKPRKINLAMYVLATVLMAYTHFFGLFVVLAEVIFLLTIKVTADGPSMRARAAAVVAISLLLVPLIPFIIKNASITSFWIEQPSADFLFAYFVEYFGSSLIAVGVALVLFYGVVRYSRGGSRHQLLRLLLLCIAVALVAPYARSLTATPMLTTRNTIVALPAILILIAIGFAEIRDGVLQTVSLFVFAVFSLLLIFHQPPYYRTATKPQIREAALALIAEHPDSERVFAEEYVARAFNVYFKFFDAPFRAQPLNKLDDLKYKDGAQPTQFWLVYDSIGDPVADQTLAGRELHIVREKLFLDAGIKLVKIAR